MVSGFPCRSALHPLPAATTASADLSLRVAASAFQPSGEVSPGKNALLHRTTVGFTLLRLDHESFAATCPLALLGSAYYPNLVHRLAVSLHASSPQSVALMQLRFASLAVINLRWDLHPRDGRKSALKKQSINRKGAEAPRKHGVTERPCLTCWVSRPHVISLCFSSASLRLCSSNCRL